MGEINKVVLAYSGGLDTSVILKWLLETYGCQVVAFTADIGQGEELEGLEEKALATGAAKLVVRDLKEEFARDYVFAAIRGNAVYEGGYLLGTSIARPIIAKYQVEVAHLEGADAVAHGATGKGNDQVRFELTYMALDPGLKIIAPWRDPRWSFKSRSDMLAYARQHGIPVEATPEKPYSCDRNLMHLSFEGGILEDPWLEPQESMFKLTVSPERAPDEPTYLEIDFKDGNPVGVDGVEMSPGRLLAHLNELGGRNGIGRVDLVENRFVGMKSRGVYETPGGTILHVAHRAMESLTMDREVMHIRDSLAPRYAELIYYGFWFSPEMELLQRTMDQAQKGVTGTVRLKLYKGNCMVVGRKAPKSLYVPDLATFETEQVYNQQDATGFIRLQGLRLRVRHLVKGAAEV
ncbi:MAG: argininosuccinate synthase [bacterium]